MPSTFGQWLIVILALLVGLAGGWALWGRQKPTVAAPIVEGDPVVGLSPEEKAAATIDAPRPDATVDTAPLPAAVVDEPAPHQATTTPTTGDAAPTTGHTAPDDDTPLVDQTTADQVPADRASADQVPDLDGTPTTVAAERPVPLTDIEDEPATADRTGRTASDPTPVAPVADGSTATVPAPRTAVEDSPDPATELPEPAPADAEPTATGPALSDPVTERPAEPTAEAEPADPVPAADPATAPDPAPRTPITGSEPEPATPATAPEPITPAAADADHAPTTPVTAPEPTIPAAAVDADDAPTTPAAAPERTAQAAVDADDAPATVTPVVPTQRTDPDRALLQDAATGQDEPADDFRRIQGVGPKIATALQAAGIRTYRQLAELDEASLRDTIRAAGLRATASLATWPQQAKVLAGAGAEATRVLPTLAGGDTRD
ncbi:helix-hairpin-helix domain-containing protein [Micromonospora rifamycinica]|uniref:helix-hairpin-helix domain-containing protein n=1 Tax=Micromonospora rifamycinica TaxID=291594 RepID=UPI00344883C2